jgi:hypothetical protein
MRTGFLLQLLDTLIERGLGRPVFVRRLGRRFIDVVEVLLGELAGDDSQRLVAGVVPAFASCRASATLPSASCCRVSASRRAASAERASCRYQASSPHETISAASALWLQIHDSGARPVDAA